MRIARGVTSVALAFVSCWPLLASAGEVRYERAPDSIRRVIDAEPTPLVRVGTKRDIIAIVWPERYRPIAVESRPYLRLAGLRIDPRNNGLHRMQSYARIDFQRIGADEPFMTLRSTAAMRLGALLAGPGGETVAVEVDTGDAVRLGIIDYAARRMRIVPGLRLNRVLGQPIVWMPDGHHLLALAVAVRGEPPHDRSAPAGPVIEDATGRTTAAPTFEDLLRTPADDARFSFYARSRLALIDAGTLRVRDMARSDAMQHVAPSPDGRYLLVTALREPFSHVQPASGFARRTEVLNAHGRLVRIVGDRDSDDAVPVHGVTASPREFAWRPNEPATLQWLQALDGGRTDDDAKLRDALRALPAPFTGPPRDVVSLERRFSSIIWVDGSPTAIVQDYDRSTRMRHTSLLDVSGPDTALRPLWSVRDGDRYNDPGFFDVKRATDGDIVAVRDGDDVFVLGRGVGRDGSRPFADRLNVRSLMRTSLFRSELQPLETALAVIDPRRNRLLVSRTSRTDPLNYFVREGARLAPLTHFTDPVPEVQAISRQVVHYKRSDGVDLSFTLYLPPGYRAGAALPTLLWAYPSEFSSAALAGQSGDPLQSMTTITDFAQLMALQGYAVLDDVSVPVIGMPWDLNDTFVEQVDDDVAAAVKKAVELGVTDPDRVAIGGYSYGAFMTANVLAHTRLFRAGIALSGAYNRTLTPFGYQSESRTLWQAPETYLKISPFMYADRIRDPLLLIHGASDDNSGTFPLQSERFFAALRANGATARLVMLPGEAHQYVARESFETVLAEMVQWLDRYVKAAPARPAPPARGGP
jgi:dipeptidyl aminopeptidase/acylaminoacyl peptidase